MVRFYYSIWFGPEAIFCVCLILKVRILLKHYTVEQKNDRKYRTSI